LTAARLGLTPQILNSTLYHAFGESQVSTIYSALNQYYVIMEAAPPYLQSPEGLNQIYLIARHGPDPVPLRPVTQAATATMPVSVNHTGLFPSATQSFNLAPGVSLGEAASEMVSLQQKLGMPPSIHGQFSGTLQAFQQSLTSEPYLVGSAILAVYL